VVWVFSTLVIVFFFFNVLAVYVHYFRFFLFSSIFVAFVDLFSDILAFYFLFFLCFGSLSVLYLC